MRGYSWVRFELREEAALIGVQRNVPALGHAGPNESVSVRVEAEGWGPSAKGMFAFPFIGGRASQAAYRAFAERLSGVWGLGYNIAHEGGRTELIAIFFAAFYRGAPQKLPAAFAGTRGEEGE